MLLLQPTLGKGPTWMARSCQRCCRAWIEPEARVKPNAGVSLGAAVDISAATIERQGDGHQAGWPEDEIHSLGTSVLLETPKLKNYSDSALPCCIVGHMYYGRCCLSALNDDWLSYGGIWPKGKERTLMCLFFFLGRLVLCSGCCLSVRFPVQLVISPVSALF